MNNFLIFQIGRGIINQNEVNVHFTIVFFFFGRFQVSSFKLKCQTFIIKFLELFFF